MEDDKCPWCSQRAIEGKTVPAFFNGRDYIPCPWCHGTGTGGSWRQHPEYARQLADERLAPFRWSVFS